MPDNDPHCVGIAGVGEFDRGMRTAWETINGLIKSGPLDEPAHSERNGMVLAANVIIALLDE